MDNAVGLVMTGGGARGAYQVGILKRIGEIKRVQTHGNPFPIIGGSSAGAINGCALAAGSDDFALAAKVLARVWSDLRPSDVFHCDVLSQTRNSLTWILDLSFGGVLGGGNARSLLDATPLRHFLSKHLRCSRIQDNIKRGHVYALAISATNYTSGKSYLFIEGKKNDEIVGQQIRIKAAKNKTSTPFKECLVDLNYTSGFDENADVLNFLDIRSTNIPVWMDKRTGLLQVIARKMALLRSQGLEPNLFDFSFKVYTVKSGIYYNLAFKDVGLIAPEDKAKFGALYIQLINARLEQQEAQEQKVAAEADATVTAEMSEPTGQEYFL